MKELQQHIKEEIAIVKPVEQKKQVKHIGALLPQPGQKVYELNIATAKITEAEIIVEHRLKRGDIKQHKKVNVKHGHLYCCAINKTVAEKKFRKQITNIVANVKKHKST